MSRMFPFITMTWNPFTGPCPYECTYCWAKNLINRYKWPKYITAEPGIDEKQINKTFKPTDFVFVQDMSDASTAHFEAVSRVMLRIETNPDTKFLFLVKNPSCYLEWIKSDETRPPKNTILGATIETNDSALINQFSKAPPPNNRLHDLYELTKLGFKTFVSIEPVMNFDLEQFYRSLYLLDPWAVAIGYDNYHNNLPEPPLSKVRVLIAKLEMEGIKVYKKTLRESLASKNDGLRRDE